MPKKVRLAENSNLPLVGTIQDKYVTKLVNKLLTEAREHTINKLAAESQIKTIKQQLAEIAADLSMPGFKNNLVGYEYRGLKSRETLSKAKLVENGVDPQIIKASYVQGKSYIDARIIPFGIEVEDDSED